MTNEWAQDLCGCFENVPWCLVTCFFPCVTSFKVASKLGLKIIAYGTLVTCALYFAVNAIGTHALVKSGAVNYYSEELVDPGWMKVNRASDLICLLLFLLFALMVAKLRYNMRQTYSLEGSSVADGCYSILCIHCVLCQMNEHLEYAENLEKTPKQ